MVIRVQNQKQYEFKPRLKSSYLTPCTQIVHMFNVFNAFIKLITPQSNCPEKCFTTRYMTQQFSFCNFLCDTRDLY